MAAARDDHIERIIDDGFSQVGRLIQSLREDIGREANVITHNATALALQGQRLDEAEKKIASVRADFIALLKEREPLVQRFLLLESAFKEFREAHKEGARDTRSNFAIGLSILALLSTWLVKLIFG